MMALWQDEEEGAKYESIKDLCLKSVDISMNYKIIINQKSGESYILKTDCVQDNVKEGQRIIYVSYTSFFIECIPYGTINDCSLDDFCCLRIHTITEKRKKFRFFYTTEKNRVTINEELTTIEDIPDDKPVFKFKNIKPISIFNDVEKASYYVQNNEPIVLAFCDILKENPHVPINGELSYRDITKGDVIDWLAGNIIKAIDLIYVKGKVNTPAGKVNWTEPYGSPGVSSFLKDPIKYDLIHYKIPIEKLVEATNKIIEDFNRHKDDIREYKY
jgi:hypothetical protein